MINLYSEIASAGKEKRKFGIEFKSPSSGIMFDRESMLCEPRIVLGTGPVVKYDRGI